MLARSTMTLHPTSVTGMALLDEKRMSYRAVVRATPDCCRIPGCVSNGVTHRRIRKAQEDWASQRKTVGASFRVFKSVSAPLRAVRPALVGRVNTTSVAVARKTPQSALRVSSIG